jgi:hypothetical protein
MVALSNVRYKGKIKMSEIPAINDLIDLDTVSRHYINKIKASEKQGGVNACKQEGLSYSETFRELTDLETIRFALIVLDSLPNNPLFIMFTEQVANALYLAKCDPSEVEDAIRQQG